MARDGSGRFGRRLEEVREGSGQALAAAGPLGLGRSAGLAPGRAGLSYSLGAAGLGLGDRGRPVDSLGAHLEPHPLCPQGARGWEARNLSTATAARSGASGQRETAACLTRRPNPQRCPFAGL